MNVLTIVTTAATDELAVRLSKIASWIGVTARIVRVGGLDSGLPHNLVPGDLEPVFAFTADALLHMLQRDDANRIFAEGANGNGRRILIFGFNGNPLQDAVLSWLTKRDVCQSFVQRSAMMTISFPAEGQFLSRQLAGTEYTTARGGETVVFDTTGPQANILEIVRADLLPIFIRISAINAEVYVLGGSDIVDIETIVCDGSGMEPFYDRVLPSIMFLRECFGSLCWHSPQPVARLVIDDPLLSERYGYLEYARLFDSMEHSKYATTIAFIPWNHWRTRRKLARRMLSNGTRLSICVHGCDHTNREFSGRDAMSLGRKARLAMDRMRRHAKRTGTTFDPIMVFPQGKFSAGAIEQLEATGFLAVANSTCLPWLEPEQCLTISELMLPAVTHWNGFPIFQRQYPSQRFQCALSLFLGRPLILVEHHQYFRDGLGPLEQCVADLYCREPRLVFPSLRDLVVQSCLIRVVSQSTVEVQFFTRNFEFNLPNDSVSRVLLRKHEPDGRRVSSVLVNDRKVAFELRESHVCFEVSVSERSGVIRVNVEVLPLPEARPRPSYDIVYECGVLARRVISELRDNVLCRNEVVFRFLRNLARSAGLTGDSEVR